MPLIEWKDEFNTGVAEVDAEHRELIELINELHASAVGNGSWDAIIDFLGEIYARISAHFALEEKIMLEQRYDQYEDHKADHERLLEEIRDIMDEYEDGSDGEELLASRLNDWFTLHFKTKDARLHKHLG